VNATETELDQRRRNVRAMDLLDASHRAYHRGLRRAHRRLSDSAWETAPETCAAVLGAMKIGGVPNPDTNPQGWAEYVQIQRDGLARLEAEEAR
jgi:hypothetical protein